MMKKTNGICDKKATSDECELAMLRNAIEEIEEKKENVMTDEVRKIIQILKKFMIRQKVICYGGTAINNILPKKAQFYDNTEIPDYDFYSKTPLQDAKMLADIYNKHGFHEVEAKAGVHSGTFKVFVNYIPIADITYLEETIFDNIQKESITVDKIQYAPPNYLRMSMFLELSRPDGDITRWEKVFNRLQLLNEYYPLKVNTKCFLKKDKEEEEEGKSPSLFSPSVLFQYLFELLVKHEVVFFGGYAFHLYSDFFPKKTDPLHYQYFDVIADEYETISELILKSLTSQHIPAVLKKNESLDEIIPENIEIIVNNITVVCLYKPKACYSYNEITIQDNGKENTIKIASIDTMLSFYLAFIYANGEKNNIYNTDRLLCMASILFDIEQTHRNEPDGILKRFSTDCYGKQKSLIDIRSEKTEKFKELSSKQGTDEYDWWFLRYRPFQNKHKTTTQKHRKYKQHKIKTIKQRIKQRSNNLIQF
jgi:hypothetical protein